MSGPLEGLVLTASDGGVTLAVRAQPRSSREAITGVRDGALRVSITAPPVEGEANAALCAFLAKVAGVAKRDVTLVAGDARRDKRVHVAGVTEASLRAALEARAPR